MKNLKVLHRLIFGRTVLVVIFLLIQIGILCAGFLVLHDYITYLFGGFTLLSTAVVIYILNKQENPGYQMAWMIPVLVFPVFGVLFYLYMELEIGVHVVSRRYHKIIQETDSFLVQDVHLQDQIKVSYPQEERLVSYLNHYGGYPAYEDTFVQYFPLGEVKFEQLIEELNQAQEFIFLEYFIVDYGYMWSTILEVLERKAAAGVEVRVMYDGMCSLMLLPYHYPRQLQDKGIKCKMYAPIKPIVSSYQNNRDHRKIAVIDGHTAFTGGVNLADEYINKKECYGHWKDTAVMIKGAAVNSFTIMFLQMWNISEQTNESYQHYLTDPAQFANQKIGNGGFVIPYGDNPFGEEAIGENVYTNILYQAKRYVHIMTPYLILDHHMLTALIHAAKSGIEVIIIMPHIPDKQVAYLSARSYYKELIQGGVQIYEYTPGFIHAKSFVSDDDRAVVGTINLDYRSLYLHFECALYLSQNEAVIDIEKDFHQTLCQCQMITVEDCQKFPLVKRLAGRALRIFAPLM